jgi:hypothetical protein
MHKTIIMLLATLFACVELGAAVTLTESQVQWKAFRHTVNADFSLQNDTFGTDIVTRAYKSLVLENEYLKVTLVPEYGGRILSMIYKPTGHEQLYQNPIGRPYGPQWDAFYYDWLMLWGGIFPTFSEPEHGKAWCRPWAYTITRNTAEEVSVKMTFTDSINFSRRPSQFKYGATNITCDFEVTLQAGTTALKTSVSLVNPTNGEIPYEYWTNVGVAPGSVTGNTRCDDQTEIVGPVSTVKIGADWPDIRKAEQLVSGELYRFEKLRWYKNWTNDGIAYAWPVEGRFWGALNHKNNEAIIRVADNAKTPGLKLWGFGYNQSRTVNPETPAEYRRPFIEMWAGASKEFFSPARLPGRSTLQFDEYYTPTTGLSSMTHASERAVVDLVTDKARYDGASDRQVAVSCRYFVTRPAERVTVRLRFKGGSKSVTVHEVTTNHESSGPFNEIVKNVAVQDLCDEITLLAFEMLSEETVVMNAEIPVAISNGGTCSASSCRESVQRLTRDPAGASAFHRLYAINGSYIGTVQKLHTAPPLKTGVFLTIDKKGRCNRIVLLRR